MLTRNGDELLSRASELVARHMGLHFPRERYEDLERGLLAAAPDLGFKDINSCLESLFSRALTRSQVEILASYLTIGETYFFREEGSFKAFEDRILAELNKLPAKYYSSLEFRDTERLLNPGESQISSPFPVKESVTWQVLARKGGILIMQLNWICRDAATGQITWENKGRAGVGGRHGHC